MRIYTQANYFQMPVGEVVIDNFLGCEWKVEAKISGGVRLRNNRDGGVSMDATPDNISLFFRTVK